MAIKSKPCKECGSIFHTKMYHTPRKPLKRTAIKPKNHIADTSKKVSKPRKKSTPRKLAKDKAWTAFSAYIRTRDCLRFTGDESEGMCITCKIAFPYKKLQAGHFVGGRGNAVLFDERLVYSQCAYCNQKPPMGLGGNYASYALFMIDEWGREQTEAFLRLKGTDKVYKQHDFEELTIKYKLKTKELLNA